MIFFVEPKDYGSDKETFRNCESKLWNIINGIKQLDSKRIIHKFFGYTKKKINNAYIYIIQSDMSPEKPWLYIPYNSYNFYTSILTIIKWKEW